MNPISENVLFKETILQLYQYLISLKTLLTSKNKQICLKKNLKTMKKIFYLSLFGNVPQEAGTSIFIFICTHIVQDQFKKRVFNVYCTVRSMHGVCRV